MKSFCTILLLAMAMTTAAAQSSKAPEYVSTEASDLTLTGKLMTDTPNPYHRVDTVRFKGFTKSENGQVRMSSGIGVAFRTDSKSICIKTAYGLRSMPTNTAGYSARGYDLYIKKDGKWLWAAAGVVADKDPDGILNLISDMDGSMHECLLYLPTFSEEYSIKIMTEKGSTIEASENPFRHRIGLFGSSYTHGASTSRSGMAYPAQLSRMTGLQFLSLGCSGNSKLQSYFADVLAAANMDALVLDGFSNPSPEIIAERLFPFIEKVQAAHPGMPIIFQKTIYREKRNFNCKTDSFEAEKMATADSLMAIAVKKYNDVYYIRCTNATSKSHETTQDGVHPDNQGYTLWAESVEKPIRKILRKYGIK
jgi:hypothetical protein